MAIELEIIGQKPWIVWNDLILNRGDEVEGFDKFQNVLYGSQKDPTPKISRFPSDWDRENVSQDIAIPQINNVRSVALNPQTDVFETTGISFNKATCYLFIPVNERGEAGPWYYMPFMNGQFIDTDQDVFPGTGDTNDITPKFTLEVNDATSYVEVWKVRERSLANLLNDASTADTSFYLVAIAHRRTVIDVDEAVTAITPSADLATSIFDQASSNIGVINISEASIILADPNEDGSLLATAQNWPGRIMRFTSIARTDLSPGVDTSTNYRITSVAAHGDDPLGSVIVNFLIDETNTRPFFYYQAIHHVETTYTPPNPNVFPPIAIGFYTITNQTASRIVVTEDADAGFDTVEFTDTLYLAELDDDFDSEGRTLLDRQPNLHTHWIQLATDATDYPSVVTSDNTVKTPGSAAVYNSASVMLWGNVKYPTKPPAIFYVHRFTGGVRLRLQYEYNTSSGPVYGPLVEMDDVLTMIVRAQDESALLVYAETTEGSGVWRLYERITSTDASGNYISKADSGNSVWTFTNGDFEQSIIDGSTTTQRDVTEYVTEPTTILQSQVDRPAEILVTGATTVSDQTEILAITPARLSEDESILNYEAYVFTRDNVFVLQRSGTTIAFNIVTSSFGMNDFNDYVLTRDGICFYGSDGQLHYLSGRQILTPPLDDIVEGIWNTVYDLGYDAVEDELWVLTDTGIWIYSFRYTGWIANYDYDNSNYDVVYYYENSGMIARDARTQLPVIFAQKGDWLDSEVTTNRIGDGPVKAKIQQLDVDYDITKTNTNWSVTAGSATVTIDSIDDDSFDTTKDINAYITIPGAGTDGKDLKAQIIAVASATSCTIDRNVVTTNTSAGTLTMKWTQYVDIDHNVRSSDIIHSFKALARRPAYPRLRGTGHQLTIKNFRELREVIYNIEQSEGAN